MTALAKAFVLGLALPLTVNTAARAEPGVEAIAERVQKVYDRAKTFKARFRQQFQVKAYAKTKDSDGLVAVAKPGKLSFRYPKSGNRVVSDGKTIRVYEAESRQLFVQPVADSQYPAAFAFLLGTGKLRASFVLDKLRVKNFEGYVLRGIPKQPSPAYRTLVLYIDKKTFRVQRVLLLDAQGNRNRFDFVGARVDTKIPASEFVFVPPRGTQVVRQ